LLSKNIKIKVQRIIILPVVLYGCETGSNILREEVTGKWRRLHNEEIKDLYSDNQIKKNEMGVRPERRRPLGRPRCRGKDNIKMELHDVKWEHVLD
jgi:hypothetical protein